MNLREFFKKLRSPLGTSLLFLAAIVTLAFSAVPFLIREDAGTLQVVRSESGEASFNIPGKAKAISAAASAERQAGSGSEAVDLSEEPDRTGRPLSPSDYRTASGERSPGITSRTSSLDRSRSTPVQGPKITIIDGESGAGRSKEFVSDRFAPYGRLLACKMINTVESGDADTPLIAVVMEDLWWINAKGEKKLIIPAGTEVFGKVNGAKPQRNRLTTDGNFVLVWQATSDMVGFELQLKGIALEKSTYPDNRMLAAITDMSAGIPGQVMSNENLSKLLMYTLAFGQGLAQGYQTNEVYTDSGVTITTQDGTTKNAMARGAETLAQVMLQDVSQMIAKESYYIRVASGTEFYIFVQQVINLDDAQIADTLLNKLEEQKIQGSQKPSYKNVLNAFSGGKQ